MDATRRLCKNLLAVTAGSALLFLSLEATQLYRTITAEQPSPPKIEERVLQSPEERLASINKRAFYISENPLEEELARYTAIIERFKKTPGATLEITGDDWCKYCKHLAEYERQHGLEPDFRINYSEAVTERWKLYDELFKSAGLPETIALPSILKMTQRGTERYHGFSRVTGCMKGPNGNRRLESILCR